MKTALWTAVAVIVLAIIVVLLIILGPLAGGSPA